MQGEKKGGGTAQERQWKRTSDSMKEGEEQRAAYSYQLFKHIPRRAETLQSDYMETSANITKTIPERLKRVNQLRENPRQLNGKLVKYIHMEKQKHIDASVWSQSMGRSSETSEMSTQSTYINHLLKALKDTFSFSAIVRSI